MKLLLLTFVAIICYVNAGKTHRMLAALKAGVNGGLANGNVGFPGTLAGGLNPVVVAGGGAGVFGQPQYNQAAPGLRVFALPAPVPNVNPVPAVNTLPLIMGVPQIVPMNPPQQTLTGSAGGAMQQQPPLKPDLHRRFRRQLMKQDNTFRTTVDTQIPAPAETMATTPCDEDHHKDN